MSLKRFIVKKYIWAKSAHDAIRKEKKHPVDDVWIDDDWKKANEPEMLKNIPPKKKEIGFGDPVS